MSVITLVFLGVTAGGINIYPEAYLSAAVRTNETYFDFSQYNIQVTGLLELTPNAHAEAGAYYQPQEGISPLVWVDYSALLFGNMFRIQLGRFAVPFGAFNELDNPLSNPLISSPEVCIDAIPSPWFDWGGRVQATLPVNHTETFGLSLYLCNGLGYAGDLRDSRQFEDNNRYNSFGTRLSLVSTRFGEFGASGYYGVRDTTGDVRLAMVGFDASTKIWLVDIQGEYVAGFLSFDEDAVSAVREALNYLTSASFNGESFAFGTYLGLGFNVSRFLVPSVRGDLLVYKDFESSIYKLRRRLGVGAAVYPMQSLVIKYEFGVVDDRESERVIFEPMSFQLGVSI